MPHVSEHDEAPAQPGVLADDAALLGLGLSRDVLHYENLIESVLHPRLRALIETRDALYADVAEGTKLRHFVERQLVTREEVGPEAGPMETLVDLGQHFYATAEVEDPRRILVDVGLGLFVDFKLAEALTFLAEREAVLEARCAELTAKASRVKVQIKIVCDFVAMMADSHAAAGGGGGGGVRPADAVGGSGGGAAAGGGRVAPITPPDTPIGDEEHEIPDAD